MQGQGGRWSSQSPLPAPANPDPFADLFPARDASTSSSPAAAAPALDPFTAIASQVKESPTDFDWSALTASNAAVSRSTTPTPFDDAAVSNPDPFGFAVSLKPETTTTRLEAPRARSASPAATTPRKADDQASTARRWDEIAAQRSDPQPSIAAIVQSASDGDFAAIRSCRSLHRKRALLAAAVETWDTDIIIEVALFLEETLRQHLLLQLLSAQPIALNAFVAYLERNRDSARLVELYKALHRHEDAGLHMLNLACAEKDAHSRLIAVGECRAFFETNLGANSLLTTQAADLHALLTRQITIEERDMELAQSSGDPIWVRFPRSNIIGHPVNHLLRYCIVYHPNAQKNKLSHAKGVRDAFHVADKEWAWINLYAKAELGDWAAVSKLVQKTTFTRKAKCPVGFYAFVDAYGKYHGPRHEMAGYAEKITDLQQRYDLCMQYDLFDVAVQALSKLNDEVRLQKLKLHIQDKVGEDDLKTLSAAIDAALAKCSRKTK